MSVRVWYEKHCVLIASSEFISALLAGQQPSSLADLGASGLSQKSEQDAAPTLVPLELPVFHLRVSQRNTEDEGTSTLTLSLDEIFVYIIRFYCCLKARFK